MASHPRHDETGIARWPHLFVKGADYQGVDLEEQEVLSRWGGQLVLVPLVAGRSTSGLIASAVGASG